MTTKKDIVIGDWRMGDLAVFISDGMLLPENIALKVDNVRWHEIFVNSIKVKIKIKPEELNKEYIKPEILDIRDDIPAIKRSDPSRENIDLWTSTLKCFKIAGYRIVIKIIERNKGKSPRGNNY